jgi:hypothetical protein
MPGMLRKPRLLCRGTSSSNPSPSSRESTKVADRIVGNRAREQYGDCYPLSERRSGWPGRSAGCRPVPSNRARQRAHQPASPRPRTRSSNPVPSSGESTNFRFPVASASRLPDAPRGLWRSDVAMPHQMFADIPSLIAAAGTVFPGKSGALTWHRPLVQGLDFEMDVRGVSHKFAI